MSIITLGTINPYKVSVFKVRATVTANVQISFEYKSGKLHPGLSLSPDGEITGTVEDKVFGLDEYGTTFDQGTTTIEQNYDFIQTPLTRNFFSDTNEILEYVKYYPNYYKAMNPNLPKFNNIDNPFHLWAKNKSSK